MRKSLLLFATVIGICFAFECDDGSALMKVGCRKRNTAVFSEMLANNRDNSVASYIGEDLDWSNFGSSLTKLACACAKRASEGAYVAVALGYYGECHGAKDAEAYEASLRDSSLISNACINPSYKSCDENSNCVGLDNAEYVYTLVQAAPEIIDGGYSEWSEFSECSATCGDGIQVRERTCTNPIPANGGSDCESLGLSTETNACKASVECPVNGGLSEWSDFGKCSKSCDGGSKTRTRTCTNPAPANDGADCVGDTEDSKDCGTDPCPVNGGLSEWSDFGKCSKSCDGGSKTRTRTCTNPAPANDGADCVGDTEDSEDCGTDPCPVDGGLTTWSSYGACSKTCGSGIKHSTRTCTNPTPANGGAECSGDKSRSLSCNAQPCLGTSTCSYKYTSFQTDGDSKPAYLDRHYLHCPSGSVMNSVQLERNSDHDEIRYKYRCCASQLACTDSEKTNTATYNGGGEGKTEYLDRQDINCYQKGMSYLRLYRSNEKWNYIYDCCNINYSGATTSCYNTYTAYSGDGGGTKVEYLDRHNVACNTNYFIAKMKLERNSSHDKYRYSYTCCKINTPTGTN